jgi:hypothetical protein
LALGDECKYRDIRYAEPFLDAFWMFASRYSIHPGIVPELWPFWMG